jgi:outer membrane protein assembly factor BamB
MTRKTLVVSLCAGLALAAGGAIHAADVATPIQDWPQWGRTSLHTSSTNAIGQSLQTQLADVTYDPFVAQEKAETFGELLAHYQVPLVDRNLVLMEFKTGQYVSCDPPGSGQPYPCGPDAWNQEIWNERAFTWQNGALVELWNFQTDWKPEPNSDPGVDDGLGLAGWEPVFHAALWNGFVFVPGAGGSVYKLRESDGSLVTQYKAFGKIDPNRYVSGPLTIDPNGDVYYNVIQFDANDPWGADIRGAWLVKVEADGVVQTASYAQLAPAGCHGCGSQRPGVNVAPAVSADGKTIYTASLPQFFSLDGYLLAVNSDLTPQWNASLTVDGGQIQGKIIDLSSASPVVLPDGSVLYGVLGAASDRGNMLKFSSAGKYLTEFDFGWDDTPAIYSHDGTYSVITKDNYYDSDGPYYITQLSADLTIEWQYQSVDNFEWCVNAPAVDKNGVVYADSEDGYVYAIEQGGSPNGRLFLQSAIGAAYTPIAIGRDGKIYTENDGVMFVVGKSAGK